MPSVLFISTLSLATNPRLVKEIELAITKGFVVTVICFQFGKNAQNELLLKKFKEDNVSFICLRGGRENVLSWAYSVVSERWFRIIGRFKKLSTSELSQAISRRSKLIREALNKVHRPDLVIGHNPGALWSTYLVAEKFGSAAGFDVEDYHAGEGNDIEIQTMTRQLMNELLPKMSYVSFASPFIREAILKDTPLRGQRLFDILNYFPEQEFVPPAEITGKLKLVWFSQHIAQGRGLEEILPSIRGNANKMELHLYGKPNHAFYESFLKGYKNIFVHGAISQKNLHQALSLYDIGLAVDVPVDENRDLVLTNKLMAFLQSGLFILATNTTAQRNFLSDFSDRSLCFGKDLGSFEDQVLSICENIESIRQGKALRFEKVKCLNWGNMALNLFEEWDYCVKNRMININQ